jgi:hypothetical protein
MFGRLTFSCFGNNKKISIQFEELARKLSFCCIFLFRPTVAGIHGGPDGAYSLALSGGYEDDIDLGDCFTYTGEGRFENLKFFFFLAASVWIHVLACVHVDTNSL